MNEKAMAMIDGAIEALEANSTSAPVVEILKAAKAALPPLRAREEIARAKLKFLIEEIIDCEGREGINDYEFAEQVIALAQRTREELADADTILSSTAGQEWRGPEGWEPVWILDCDPSCPGGMLFDHPHKCEFCGTVAAEYRRVPAPPVAEPIVAEKRDTP